MRRYELKKAAKPIRQSSRNGVISCFVDIRLSHRLISPIMADG
jgi:hypothetical protein